jgi:histidine decarboxylase
MFDLDTGDIDLDAAYTALLHRHKVSRWHYLGFPVAYDLDFPVSERLASRLFNNISTTDHWPPGHQHAMEPEIAVLQWLGRLVGFPDGNRWGHITTGGTAGNRAGILAGRAQLPKAVLLYSRSAHYSVARAAQHFRIPAYPVGADPTGHLDVDQLDTTLTGLTRGQPRGSVQVIVVATYGTTMTEACDDIEGIHATLDRHHIDQRYVHLDAALAGIPAALDGSIDGSRIDSMSVSGYKFLAIPHPCGIVIGRGQAAGDHIPYTDTLDATETGVRSGLHPAMMLEAIVQQGNDGHIARAHAGRDLADYTIGGLQALGQEAWRNPEAYFTVVLPTPPEGILAKWTLSTYGPVSHIICVPGVTKVQIDEFLQDLRAALTPPRIPIQRRNLFAPFAQL